MAGYIESLTLEPGEEMRALYHRHGMTLFARLVPYAGAMVVLFLFLFPLFSLGMRGVALFSGVLALCVLFAIRTIVSWFGTITMLTNTRLLVVERFGFFKTSVSEMKLDQIFKVSYEMKGMRQTMGRYGTIMLVVMFTGDTMRIPDIPNPQEALNQISSAVSEVRRSEHVSAASPQAAGAPGKNQPSFHIGRREDRARA